MNKKGDIYFRDIHGNFHKLETNDLNEELMNITGFDNILSSLTAEKITCNYKPLNYYKLNLTEIKNGKVSNDKIVSNKGLYRFSTYLSLTTEETQRIYFFFRNKNIFKNTLQTQVISEKIPNNLNSNFILNLDNELFEVGIISEKNLTSISAHILYSQIN